MSEPILDGIHSRAGARLGQGINAGSCSGYFHPVGLARAGAFGPRVQGAAESRALVLLGLRGEAGFFASAGIESCCRHP